MVLNGATEFIAGIVFVVSYFVFFDQNIYWAAGLFAITLAAQYCAILGSSNVRISNLMWIALGVAVAVLLFALVFQFSDAIKWRPTIIFWTISVICAFAFLLGRFEIFKWVAGKWSEFFDFVWKDMCVTYGITFLIAGVSNLAVAYMFHEQVWVLFVAFAWMFYNLMAKAVLRFIPSLSREENFNESL